MYESSNLLVPLSNIVDDLIGGRCYHSCPHIGGLRISGATKTVKTLYNAIWDLWYPKNLAVLALPSNKMNPNLVVPNHEYFESTYSPHYMLRNIVRGWFESSFTIQVGTRYAPIHL